MTFDEARRIKFLFVRILFDWLGWLLMRQDELSFCTHSFWLIGMTFNEARRIQFLYASFLIDWDDFWWGETNSVFVCTHPFWLIGMTFDEVRRIKCLFVRIVFDWLGWLLMRRDEFSFCLYASFFSSKSNMKVSLAKNVYYTFLM